MKYVSLILLLAVILGCSNDLPEPDSAPKAFFAESIPEFNPEDPASLAEWEASSSNFSNVKLHVVKLHCFHGDLSLAQKQPTSVALHVLEAKDKKITPELQAAMDNLVENEQEIYLAVRDAIYEYYKKAYPSIKKGMLLGCEMFGGNPKDVDELLPAVSSGDEIDRHIRLSRISINPAVDGVVPISFTFDAAWDEENGIGVLFRDGKVQRVGGYYEAFP